MDFAYLGLRDDHFRIPPELPLFPVRRHHILALHLVRHQSTYAPPGEPYGLGFQQMWTTRGGKRGMGAKKLLSFFLSRSIYCLLMVVHRDVLACDVESERGVAYTLCVLESCFCTDRFHQTGAVRAQPEELSMLQR